MASRRLNAAAALQVNSSRGAVSNPPFRVFNLCSIEGLTSVPVMSTLANVTVYCLKTKSTLTQWRIVTMNPPDVTFIDFLRDSNLTQSPFELKKVYVGKQKDCVDEADITMCVSQVVSMFGPFIKFHVESRSSSLPQQPARNVFEVLREGQRQLEMKKLPSCIEHPKNKKQKLRNAIIDMLNQNGLLFKHTAVATHGEQLVSCLTETLWYIDGHHDVVEIQ